MIQGIVRKIWIKNGREVLGNTSVTGHVVILNSVTHNRYLGRKKYERRR